MQVHGHTTVAARTEDRGRPAQRQSVFWQHSAADSQVRSEKRRGREMRRQRRSSITDKYKAQPSHQSIPPLMYCLQPLPTHSQCQAAQQLLFFRGRMSLPLFFFFLQKRWMTSPVDVIDWLILRTIPSELKIKATWRSRRKRRSGDAPTFTFLLPVMLLETCMHPPHLTSFWLHPSSTSWYYGTAAHSLVQQTTTHTLSQAHTHALHNKIIEKKTKREYQEKNKIVKN